MGFAMGMNFYTYPRNLTIKSKIYSVKSGKKKIWVEYFNDSPINRVKFRHNLNLKFEIENKTRIWNNNNKQYLHFYSISLLSIS